MFEARIFLFLLPFMSTFVATKSYAGSSKVFQAFTATNSVTIWQDIGFTNADCEPLDPEEFEKFSQKRKEYTLNKRKAAEKACKERTILSVNPGDVVHVRTNKNGEGNRPVEVTTDVNFQGYKEKRKFVLGKVAMHPSTDGWISREDISQVEERTELFNLAELCTDCGLTGKTTGLPEQTKEIEVANQALEISDLLFPAEITMKPQSEIDRFVCLHRSPYGPTNDNEEFLSQNYPKFKDATEQAEKAYGVPKQLLLCGLLAESNYKPGQESDAGAKGYAQVMPATMAYLEKIAKQKPYSDMGLIYKSTPFTKNSKVTNQLVRIEDHLVSNVEAMALNFRVMLEESLKSIQETNKCSDKKANLSNLTRKDIYLLLIGYNAGPGYIPKVCQKTPVELRRTNPPPQETNKYIEKIEKCLEQGKETSFAETPAELRKVSDQRKKEIRQLEAEIVTLQKNYNTNNEIYKYRREKIEQRQQAIEAKKLDLTVKVPAQVASYPKPESPDQKIADLRKKIAFREDLNKHEANASFGRRMNMCNASLPSPNVDVANESVVKKTDPVN